MGYHYDAFLFDPAAAIEWLDTHVVVGGQIDITAWKELLHVELAKLDPVGDEYLASQYLDRTAIDDDLADLAKDPEDCVQLDTWFLCSLASWVRSAPSLPGRGVGLLEPFLLEQQWPEDIVVTLIKGRDIRECIRPSASATLAGALEDRFPNGQTGWIPVSSAEQIATLLGATAAISRKSLSFDAWRRMQEGVRSTEDQERWFRAYEHTWPAKLDEAIAVAQAMVRASIDEQHPLILGYGW